MQLIYGTTNRSKLGDMQDMLKGLDLQIVGLEHFAFASARIKEAGKNPLDNARIKALAYFRVLRKPVFSCDSGLYIEGLAPHEQPGVHIRRVNGRELDDDEMLLYYAGLVEKLGGPAKAKYRNAICLVMNDENIYEHDGDDLASEPFLLTSLAHPIRKRGFPLDSLSLHCETGKYYLDLAPSNGNKCDLLQAAGFRRFFAKVMKGEKRGFAN